MKIDFEIMLADSFTFPEDDGITNMHLWPHGEGKTQGLIVPIEFVYSGAGDTLREAEQTLDEYIKKTYPGKDYRIYYWWWKD